MSAMKISVISEKPETLEAMRRLLEGHQPAVELSMYRRPDKAAVGGKHADAPDLLVLDRSDSAGRELGAVEDLMRQHPNLTVLLLCPSRTEDVLVAAMRAGVREVLEWPADKYEFIAAVERARKRLATAANRSRRARLLAFMSCKGGSGATFLAANLAYALAAECHRSVLLIDLDLQFGDASFFVTDREGAMSVADVARQVERLDPMFLASAAVELLPNFSLLAAPEDAERAMGVTAEQIDRVLDVALQSYDYVVVDLERSINPVAMKALDRADSIFVVMGAMLPIIRDAKRLLHAFGQLGYRRDKIKLVVNRLEKGIDVPLRKVEQALNVEAHWKVPNDFPNASASVNQGVPIAKLAPSSPLSRAIVAFAKDLDGVQDKPRGWLHHLFNSK